MKITLTTTKKEKPDFSKLGFGKYFTDHMLVMDYENGEWGEAEIIPYDSFKMAPSTAVLHYAQGIFEGCKAYKDKKGKITTFRTIDNFLRMNKSATRMCMPNLPVAIVLEALYELLNIDSDWIPTEPGTSLYIRPTMIASDSALGVHASHSYKFFIILSPVGAYYANGLKPTKIYIEDNFVRAAIGGTGEAKCMGNYAASLLAAEEAQKRGYDQVLWLDAAEKKYVEEVGAMNMFFVIDGVVVTPMLTGSILPGITRDSILKILKKYGYKAEERKISVDELYSAFKGGKLEEAFGAGTAAVVSPVGLISYKGEDMVINNGVMGKTAEFLYDKLTGIQCGRYEDEFGWINRLN
ncbi:MAG: branched-chain amino acid aminotransferase [Clostridia bacterium]|nr:branched-chain amino acid aminotransferase [Clostridia bacterium]